MVTFELRRPIRSAGVQLAGTLFFNATTFRAVQIKLDFVYETAFVALRRLSVRFVSGYLAYVEVTGFRAARGVTMESVIASVNLLYGVELISAVAAYVVPTTGSEINVSSVNTFTALEVLCFLIGAALLLPRADPGHPELDGRLPRSGHGVADRRGPPDHGPRPGG